MHRSPHPLTPKLWAALDVIAQVLQRHEQVAVFAPFHDPLDTLGRCLREAGVGCAQMDGRTTPARRAVFSRRFKDFEFPVILGSEACAEGHDWPQARNALLLAYSWSPDKIKQFLDRIWRINSERDINVYLITCQGTVDERMADLDEEKRDAAELVLDGELLDEVPEELSLADLLDFAAGAYDPAAKTVDEEQLQRDWPQLRHRLATAMSLWRGGVGDSRVLPGPSDAPPSPFFNSHPSSLRTQPSDSLHSISKLAENTKLKTPSELPSSRWLRLRRTNRPNP